MSRMAALGFPLQTVAILAVMKNCHPLTRVSRALDGIARGPQLARGRIKHPCRHWCRSFALQRG